MTQRTNSTRKNGLTLIETVVAVGLLSSMSALVVPTLSKAREDAKRLACQSHLGQTGAALLNYLVDLELLPMYTSSDGSWASWSFGGWSGRNRAYWEDLAGGVFNIQTNKRPLTVYMTPWTIPDEVDPLTPTQEAPLFRCPSDNISSFGGDNLPRLSAYDDVGTSYQSNFHWWNQTDEAPCPPGSGFCWPYRLSTLSYLIYEKYIVRQPERLITIIEDPADWGLAAEIQTMGYHGDFSTHMTAFADGHAEYLFMDTRHLHDSLPNPPGPRHGALAPSGRWTVCDETKEHPAGARHES